MTRLRLFLGASALALTGLGLYTYLTSPATPPRTTLTQLQAAPEKFILNPSSTLLPLVTPSLALPTAPAAPTAATPLPTEPPAPVANQQAALASQLGTTIALLSSVWNQGGGLPKQLGLLTEKLALALNQPAIAGAAQTLSIAIPPNGPTTQAQLLLETNRVLALNPPADLPATQAAAENEQSWLSKQIAKVVSINTVPASQSSWHSSLLAVQEQLAQGLIANASLSLHAAPLAADARLDPLRALCRLYLNQSGKLNNLVNAYATSLLSTTP